MNPRVAILLSLGLIPGVAAAQSRLGEVRVLAQTGWALPIGDSEQPPDAPGPPVGRAMVGGVANLTFVTGRFAAGPEVSGLLGSDRRLLTLGVVGRLALGEGRVQPYLLLGGGYYVWRRKTAVFGQPTPAWTDDTNYFSGSLGGGLVIGLQRASLVIEARGHKNLERVDWFGSRDLLTLSAGVSYSW